MTFDTDDELEVERRQAAILAQEPQEAVACPKCKGKGTYDTSCSLCGDSTFDHECNDKTYACKYCKGSGKLYTSPPSQDARVRELELANKNLLELLKHSECSYCDGSGVIHSADGELVGSCRWCDETNEALASAKE